MKDVDIKFDFNDILIIPYYRSTITSRYKDIELDAKNLPLIAAPMDTVVDLDNMNIFLENGIKVALPRTISHDEFIKKLYKNAFYGSQNKDIYDNVFVSMGFETLEKELSNNFSKISSDAHILIDVANGHMNKVLDYCKQIKAIKPNITIMVGNIANPDTYYWYAESQCVDYIRVGIGNGGGCLTTKQSGVGYPMASLIYFTYVTKRKFISNNPDKKAPAIVADGGMKDYSDVIKALGLGADYVMIGSIFNKSLESCAKNYLYGIKINKKLAKFFFKKGYPVKKYFRGMSTKEAQKAMGKTKFKTSEGVVRFRRVEYSLYGWVENFRHYLRNAMSYSNADSLDRFIGKIDVCQITKNAYDRFNK